jgi:catechol 2,3-dioxygenase-like lactoylglutathione lyase family enzyme
MPIVLDHMTVPVHDMEATLDFYVSLFAGRKGSARGRIVGLWLSDALELQFRATEAVATNHYAFRVESDAFDVLLGRLKSRGIPYGTARNELNGEVLVREDSQKAVFFADPNGHELELISRI